MFTVISKAATKTSDNAQATFAYVYTIKHYRSIIVILISLHKWLYEHARHNTEHARKNYKEDILQIYCDIFTLHVKYFSINELV